MICRETNGAETERKRVFSEPFGLEKFLEEIPPLTRKASFVASKDG